MGPSSPGWLLRTSSDNQGINILRACKKINEEASAILYGKNIFVFDTRGQWPFTHTRGVYEHYAFDNAPHPIPGLPNRDSSPATQHQIECTMDKSFNCDGYRPKFFFRGPMARLLNEISLNDGSLITKVKIKGFFKTAENRLQYSHNRPIGFARIFQYMPSS